MGYFFDELDKSFDEALHLAPCYQNGGSLLSR